MVILACLPPTVIWDVTETWFLGKTLCKLILYLQTVSVTVSVLTLTFISVDRWYAICFPLKFISTTSRAVSAIIVIWMIALVLDLPEMITLTTFSRDDLRIETILFTQCEASWDQSLEQTFSAVKIGFLYVLPLLFMSVAYFQIVKVLWSSDNIPGQLAACRRGGTFANASAEGQLRSRRKAAKMLVAVVIMFALCYLPVHLLSILRYTVNIPQNDLTAAISMLSHWLCYANSAVNPLIYNFMSGKFRKEFRRSFGPCFRSTRPGRSCRLSVIVPKTETIPLSSTIFKVD
ncbi:orexin receptor type 2 isoform X2 [Halyomorpha halys]|uniref:orexin receptor type 2 isoform X2 n=1 Tax=Halyomorpha halys TaxID=286706 RepID=UPI0034D1902B